MMIDEAVLTDYALGTLSPQDAEEVERHLRTDPDAARKVRRMQDDLADLVMSLPPEAADQLAEDALVERLRQNSRPPLTQDRVLRGSASRRSPRWVALGLAAALGVTAWLILAPIIRSDQLYRTVERYRSQPGSLSRQLVTESGEELGTLVQLQDGRLFVAFEESPSAGTYQLWEIRGGQPESLAVLDGRTILTEPVEEGSTFAVTIEPSGGSAQPTMAPLVTLPL